MPPWIFDLIVPVLVAGLSTGSVAAFFQARASRAVGVREHDVTSQKNSGDLALELIRELQDQIKDLKTASVEDSKRMDALEDENRAMRGRLAEFESAIRETIAALTDLIAWEQAGSQPPAPWRLTAILARLTRLTAREVDR